MFLFYTNLYAGLIAVVCAGFTADVFAMQLDIFLYLFIFFSTLFVYSFDRTKEFSIADQINSPVRTAFLKRFRKLIFTITWISFVIGLALFFFLNRASMYAAGFAGIFTIIYFFLPSIMKKNLFIQGAMKPFVLGITWTIITVGLPVLHSRTEADRHLLFFALSMFLLFTTAGLWFDFRDRRGDSRDQKGNSANFISEKKFLIMIALISLSNLMIASIYIKSIPLILLSGYYLFISIFYRELKVLHEGDERMYLVFIDLPLFFIPAAAQIVITLPY
ncbi:MAG: hypothetical protein OEZ34_03685 [Spirochaetia bacterium]|nr:hypothetical protein [Spirochaetia bacterium]